MAINQKQYFVASAEALLPTNSDDQVAGAATVPARAAAYQTGDRRQYRAGGRKDRAAGDQNS